MLKSIRSLLLLAALLPFAPLALAQSGVAVSAPPPQQANTPEGVVRQTLKKLVPEAQIDQITPAALPGFYQVIASGHLVYISGDGKYVINGDLIDTQANANLSDKAWAAFRKTELAKVPAAQRVVFAPPHPKYTVTVFTDVTCPYCRVLHSQIEALNKEGIAVEYLAWPRAGVVDESGKLTPTYKEMVSTWCSADPAKALTAAMGDHQPVAKDCANPVKDQFELGLRLGVTGTPAVYTEDGRYVGGYLNPAQMLQAVQDHSIVGG